jgi:hypothetical protein
MPIAVHGHNGSNIRQILRVLTAPGGMDPIRFSPERSSSDVRSEFHGCVIEFLKGRDARATIPTRVEHLGMPPLSTESWAVAIGSCSLTTSND